MPKRHKLSEEQIRELEKARKQNKNKNVDNRMKALLLHASGKKIAEIADKTGFAETYISELMAKYVNHGLGAIVDNHYKGNRRNMSFEEEQVFLFEFKENAKKGQIIEVSTIKNAYEAKVGHSIGKGQIYRVLHRHGWRKVMPRSKHPNKASDEVIEASKKLTPASTN